MIDHLRLIVRVLVAVVVALAAGVAILAFLPATENHYENGVEIQDAGGWFVAASALAVAAPGLVAWRRPRALVLWSWVVVATAAAITGLAFLADIPQRHADVVLWPVRAIELASWALAGLATLGPLLAGFAIRAAQLPCQHTPSLLAPRLRRFICVLGALGVVLAVVGLLPGSAVYDDANGCAGRALGALGLTEHHHVECTASYTVLRSTGPAGGWPVPLYALLLLAPAVELYRSPGARRAWWWIAWSVVTLVASSSLWLVVAFHFDVFSHTEILWPTRVVLADLAVIQTMMLVVLPTLLLRSRASRVPVARVVATGHDPP